MKFYRQYDYPAVQLGEYGGVSLATAGCFIVSLANLANIEPVTVNRLLIKNKCFSQGNMLSNKKKTAQILNLEYAGRTTEKPDFICISETADTRAPQHFFLYDPKTGKMNDPLSKKRGWEKCKYSIKSYRTFQNIQNTVAYREDDSVVIDHMATKNVKDTIINILAELKKVYETADEIKHQGLRVNASQGGRLIRQAQALLGLEVNE